MFLGLTDPDSLVRGMDLDLDPSIIKQKSKKNLDSYCFVTSLLLFVFEKLIKYSFKTVRTKKNNFYCSFLKDINSRIQIRVHPLVKNKVTTVQVPVGFHLWKNAVTNFTLQLM
jgi:hypothetical protein